MPETPEELYARAHAALRMPPLGDWESFPFAGDITLRTLAPPVVAETPRGGQGGIDCDGCSRPDGDYFWTDDTWRLFALPPSGMPIVVILEPREHLDAPGDLSDDMASALGRMLARVERAVRGVGEIGRVHVCRWGDGAEHLHWWFIARPARLPQVTGSLCELWDEVLPPTLETIWADNVARIAAAMDAG
jgi:diadenosine tetraphosphate (Ap4A) HIT family hydrolase